MGESTLSPIENTVEEFGGAILYSYLSTLVFESLITNNCARFNGGGIIICNIFNSEIFQNPSALARTLLDLKVVEYT